jgi:hypothetical protein
LEERTIAAIAVRVLEAAMDASEALRDNKLLHSRLNALRRPPPGSRLGG